MTQGMRDWTFCGFSGLMGGRGRERSPWYDMATAAVAMIARPYIPQGGKVYALGCSAGNVGRVLAPALHEREAQFVALDGCRDVVVAYCGPGRAIMADVVGYPYKPFDVVVAFLTLMDLPASTQRHLLSTLRNKMRPGGAKRNPTVLSPLWHPSQRPAATRKGRIIKRRCGKNTMTL